MVAVYITDAILTVRVIYYHVDTNGRNISEKARRTLDAHYMASGLKHQYLFFFFKRKIIMSWR